MTCDSASTRRSVASFASHQNCTLIISVSQESEATSNIHTMMSDGKIGLGSVLLISHSSSKMVFSRFLAV